MSTKRLAEEATDDIVIAQADDEAAWEEPLHVSPSRQTVLSLSAELIARVAFFARVHHAASPEAWLHHVIRERLEVEEAAFAAVKRDLLGKGSR